MSQEDFRPSPPSRSSTSSSKKSLTLDLSNLPPLQQPTPASNTLLFTNLQDVDIFRPDNLQKIRDLVSQTAPIHAWAPLKSFRRILVSFFSDEAAIQVRSVWDGEAIMGSRCHVYFGQPTPLDNVDMHLALPDAGKLFFISPPPSPPHGWEMRLEEAPNKQVHAEDLADALGKLQHRQKPMADSPMTPVDDNAGGAFSFESGCRVRSRSSTLIYQPEAGSNADLPAIAVVDTTEDDFEIDGSPMMVDSPKPILAHTSRPPVELMQQ